MLIHATSHDSDRSPALSQFAKMFESVSTDAMAYLMSSWRGDVNLLDLGKPAYQPFSAERRPLTATRVTNPVIDQAIEALARIGQRKAG